MVRHGAFRPDLFDRLNILQLETIPLRFQRERIRELFVKEMERQSETVGRTLPFEIDDAAVEAVQSLEWRGNYRELKNFAVRLAVEAMDETAITAELVIQMARDGWAGETTICPASEDRSSDILHEPRHTKKSLVMVTFDAETDDLDTVYVKAAATFIEHALKQSNGNLRRAARSMNTTHSTLSRILKKNNERKARIDVSSNDLSLSAAA